jgi:hypothetical protein
LLKKNGIEDTVAPDDSFLAADMAALVASEDADTDPSNPVCHSNATTHQPGIACALCAEECACEGNAIMLVGHICGGLQDRALVAATRRLSISNGSESAIASGSASGSAGKDYKYVEISNRVSCMLVSTEHSLGHLHDMTQEIFANVVVFAGVAARRQSSSVREQETPRCGFWNWKTRSKNFDRSSTTAMRN